MPAYRRHFFLLKRDIQASLRVLREPNVDVGSPLNQLDALHDSIALASVRQLGGFGLEP
jgi:hypothetical protein